MRLLRKVFGRPMDTVQEKNKDKDEQFEKDFVDLSKRVSRAEAIVNVYEQVVRQR